MITALARSFGPPKANKFRAIRTQLDGFTFDSKRESAVYAELKLREKAREIVQLQVHPKWEIRINGNLIASYKADFSFKELSGRFRVIDVKSEATAKRRDFVLIRKLMAAVYRIEVEIWT